MNRKDRFPWVPLLLLLISLGVFWGIPWRTGTPEMQVEFTSRP